MTTFSYKVVYVGRMTAEEQEEFFQKLGKEGFELVHIESSTAYFKKKALYATGGRHARREKRSIS
jgi:hypothetical protein